MNEVNEGLVKLGVMGDNDRPCKTKSKPYGWPYYLTHFESLVKFAYHFIACSLVLHPTPWNGRVMGLASSWIDVSGLTVINLLARFRLE